MAIDDDLLDEAERFGRASLRLYRWDPPCLSFGRNEQVAERYDLEEIARRGIDTVRRPTGGRAVWHEHEVTYAVAAPIAAFESLRRAYQVLHGRLAAALQSLGVSATLAPRPTHPPIHPSAGPTACFAAPAGGEVLVDGRKLVGSAQVRRRAAFLQHGSILLDGSQDIVDAVSRQPADGGGVGRKTGETTLTAVLGRRVGFEELAAAIIATWPEPLGSSAHLAAPARP